MPLFRFAGCRFVVDAGNAEINKRRPQMTLTEFNALSEQQARQILTPCVNIAQWVDQVIQGRPYASLQQAMACATLASDGWQDEAIALALAQHPRIGERMTGDSQEAALSRAEQATLGLSEQQTLQALLQGNRQYEQRFNRVFLIRAKGRTPADILAHLHRRLGNNDAQELLETAEQLQQITLLRFQELFD